MSRLFYSKPDPVDEEIISWLNNEINVKSLISEKSVYRILNENVIPNINSIISSLSPEKINHLINCQILSKHTFELLPLGKGYLFNLIFDIV